MKFKKSFRKPRGRKLNPSAAKEVHQIIKRELKRDVETKYVARVQALTSQSSTWGILDISNISQGVTDSDRVGDALTLTGPMHLRWGVFNSQGATGDVYNNFRMVIVQYHPSLDSSVFGATKIFLNGPSGSIDLYSQYNHDQRQDYTILYDKTVTTVGNNNVATTPNTSAVFKHIITTLSFKKLRKLQQYTAGGVNQSTNKLYLLTVSDSALATHPQWIYSLKYFYTDA